MKPCFAPTAIGSLPHSDVAQACNLVLDSLPEYPIWPQLPKKTFLENMYVQYTEGLPGINLDMENERIWFEKGSRFEEELEPFYQAVIAEDYSRLGISGDYAAGLELFLSGEFRERIDKAAAVKGHFTGPVSFGLTVTDKDKRASIYDETIEQLIVDGTRLKARWQCDRLREIAPDGKVILFCDEPYLVSVGSALISLDPKQVVNDIRQSISDCGADLTGIHVCGNTDWSLVFETGVDIINFDALECMGSFIAYTGEIHNHIERGGIIAWGLVPNSALVSDMMSGSLIEILEEAFVSLEEKGIDRMKLAEQSMITPACGLGPATVLEANKAFKLLGEVTGGMRERYF